jgi:hypothetical protein
MYTANVRATLPVVDYTHIAQSAYQEVMNYAKYAAEYAKQVEQYSTQLSQYEQQLVSIARYGDPAALRNLPAIRNIEELTQIYGQYRQDISEIQSMANPNNLKSNAEQILNEYRLPSINGMGGSGSSLQSMFQFPTSNYQVAQTISQQVDKLTETKKTLQTQRDAALSSLQNATDSAQVAKFHALINGLSAGIADINAHIQNVISEGHLQQSKNTAAQQINQAAQTVQSAQGFSNDVNNSIGQMNTLGTGYGAFPRWPDGK